jgi:hypothetical protein
VPSDAVEWLDTNQRQLTAALRRVKARLEAHRARVRGGDPGEQGSARDEAELPLDASGALDRVSALFRLSPFERDLLVLCAGVELDSGFAPLCAEAQADPHRPFPTFSLALAALPDAHWSAVGPGGALRGWRLLEVGSGSALTTSPLRIDERILHYLTGIDGADERLAGLVRPAHEGGELVPSSLALAEKLTRAWGAAAAETALPLLRLSGGTPADRETIAVNVCRMVGIGCRVLRAEALATAPQEIEALARLWQREAALSGVALLIECGDLDPSDGTRAAAIAAFVERSGGALLLGARDRWPTGRRRTVTFEVPKPTTREQRTAWEQALGPAAERLNGQVDLLTEHFDLSAQAIRSAALDALAATTGDQTAGLGQALWEACRTQARPRLDDLAQRIDGGAAWDDLVLPEAQKQVLRDVAAHVRHRTTVYERWGFAGRGSRGLGISAMFAGASGTGKTMAAEVLADDLRLDLYRIDLSAVVSKYIGETEKNLRRIFDAAEEAGAILLFDEADALFGKRSEVRDSHDRYANIEVSYLLQRMECYRGLAILTTNMKSAVDTAFLRRIRFVVQFPWPDEEQRGEIWRRVFPAAAPTERLDPMALAQLNVAGGSIRNIALHAAFLAAERDEPVRMDHLLHAARTEYAKLEKPLTEAETEGWQ